MTARAELHLYCHGPDPARAWGWWVDPDGSTSDPVNAVRDTRAAAIAAADTHMIDECSEPCWLQNSHARYLDAANLEAMSNRRAISVYYRESRYDAAFGIGAIEKRELGDFFPPNPRPWLDFLVIAAANVMALSFALSVAKNWLGLPPLNVLAYGVIAAGFVIIWSQRHRLLPLIYHTRIRNTTEGSKYARRFFTDMAREHAVFIGLRGQYVVFVHVDQGDRSKCIINMRQVIAETLRTRAHYVLMYHNHPSGDCRPSNGDHAFTRDIAVKLRDLGVEILDHAILTEAGSYSFREHEII